MLYLHITATNGSHESRLLKQAQTAVERAGFDRVLILAKQGPRERHLPLREQRHPQIAMRRLVVPKVLPGFNALIWYWRILLAAVAARPDMVSAHHVMLLPVAVIIKLLTGAALIYDAHELETEAASLVGQPRTQALVRTVERTLIRLCDHTIVVNESIADWYRRRYPRLRVTAIRNCPRRATPPRGTALRDALAIPAKTRVFLYQGVFSRGRGLTLICDVFRRGLVPDGVLVLMGYGELEDELRAAAAQSAAIRLQPPAAPDDILPFTASADVGLCLIEPICLSYELSLPNKVFEYVMAGTPVVCSHLPELARLVEEHGVGTTTTLDPDAIAGALARVVANHAAHQAACMRARETLCWETEEQRLIKIYSGARRRGSSVDQARPETAPPLSPR